jgi:hypothetical protein
MNNEKEPGKSLPYEKPKLRTISLVAEEVLGITCKQSFGQPSGKMTRGCGSVYCAITSGS